MPFSTWTFWFLAGSLATVVVGVLFPLNSRGERVGRGPDIQDGWPDGADEACALG
jgi:hypothetical protein